MNLAPGATTLIVYGDLPVFRKLRPDGTPGPIVVFDGKLTHQNRRSFERLLVRELSRLVERDLTGATVRSLGSALELQRLLQPRRFSTVVFYGHTIDITSSGSIAGRQEIALATTGQFMNPQNFAAMLKAAGVRETLIAGCSSVSFAAGVFNVAPSVRAGGLFYNRNDDAKGNASAVIDLRIQKQPIKWWALPGSQ